jgi:hypothetical protein
MSRTELVYSDQSRGFEPGRHYENPRYFRKVKEGVKHVYILGDWPKVAEAYEAAGVQVTQLKKGAPISWRDGLAPEASEGREYVEIPPTWRKYGAPRLIELAQSVAGRDDIRNRKEAERLIERELERRELEENSPVDDDGEDNGE